MKTSEDIYDDFKKWLYQTNSDKFIEYKNKKWYSEKSIKNKINKIDLEMGISKESLIKLLLSNEVNDE